MNNRLQKKCVVAATGFHLLLLMVLLFGSAFISSKDTSTDRPPIDFVPLKTVDEALSGGGNPTPGPPVAQARQAQPPPPQPQQNLQPQPQPQPDPQPQPPESPQPIKRDPENFQPPIKKLPTIVLREVPGKKTPPKSQPQNNPRQAEETARQKQIAEAIRSAANNIKSGMSGSTEVEMPAGPGGGGASYANFLDAVKKVYTDAWIVPDGVADDDATVSASVTIAKKGDVVTYRIIRPSGNRDIDRSVQMTLERVRVVVPLPESAKENQRTVTIKFNARLKRGLG